MKSIGTTISSILPAPRQFLLQFLVLDFAKLCKQLFTLIISRKTDNRTKTFTINSSFIVASSKSANQAEKERERECKRQRERERERE